MAKTTASVLDAAPAEMAQEAEPTKADDVMVERAPKGDDLGSKLDMVISMLKELDKKNDREEKMDRKLTDESDIDEMIKKLSGGEKMEGERMEKEDAVTVPAEEMSDACGKAMDALEILRKVRPAVAAIKDKSDRARVTDALMSSIRGMNQYSSILSATTDAAMRNVSKSNPEQAIAEQQKIYDSFNPHKKDR